MSDSTAPAAPTEWHDLAAEADIGADEIVAGHLPDGHEIALYRIDGQVHATDNICTHGFARLCDGFLLDNEIECPLHQARFDVVTGAVTCGPATEPIRTYPIRIEGGRVLVRR